MHHLPVFAKSQTDHNLFFFFKVIDTANFETWNHPSWTNSFWAGRKRVKTEGRGRGYFSLGYWENVERRGDGLPSLTPASTKGFGAWCRAYTETGGTDSGCVSKAQFWAAAGTCLAGFLPVPFVLLNTRGRWEAISPGPSLHSLWRAHWLEGHADPEYIPHPAFHRHSFYPYADESKGSVNQSSSALLCTILGLRWMPQIHTHTIRVKGDRSPWPKQHGSNMT